jgi:hypothetical protein
LLPTLSLLSVRNIPESRLRHWYSSRYLRISPLHREFYFPLISSRTAVSKKAPKLSLEISSWTYGPAYELFTPSNSGQRSLPTSYRGCWHVVSRSFLSWYRPFSSQLTGVYNPKTFFLHAASLRQGFPHCAIFLTAASRRSLDRVPVPVWLIVLSDQLPIGALVGRYPTN